MMLTNVFLNVKYKGGLRVFFCKSFVGMDFLYTFASAFRNEVVLKQMKEFIERFT